jgi:Flp pilus assembly protein TadD
LVAQELPVEAQDIEIMMGLLTPRVVRPAIAEHSQIARSGEAAQIISLVRTAREELEQRRAAADPVASAILSLSQEAWNEDGLADLRAALSEAMAGDDGRDDRASPEAFDARALASLIHDFAVESFRAGQAGRAIILYGALVHLKMDEAEALSGLALCGVRLNRFDDALTLAHECLKFPEKHPRAYIIAGFCELERGNRKAAQSLLALGARIARNRPEFAEDLRAAQRVLLILHFA